MNLKNFNKPININDIEFRIQSINKGKYAIILPYKNARYDMNILDDVVGAENWQKDYKIIDGNLYCGVSIKFDNEWVWKWDVGTESMSDKEKGQASDSFKRACFCWGIGRELYEFPLIQVKLYDSEVQEYQGKFKASFGLKLKEWKWEVKRDGAKIVELIGFDQAGTQRFSSNNTIVPVKNKQESDTDKKLNAASSGIPKDTKEWLNLFTKSGEKTKYYTDLEKAISDGKKYKLKGFREKYKVSKEVEKQLLDNFNIK